jgi:plasmid stabilization system protein ParE
MARKIIWSFEATDDLKAIADYIAKDSAFYAAAFVQEIRDASRSLKELSERGRIVPELSNPNIRELFVKEYRLIYSIGFEVKLTSSPRVTPSMRTALSDLKLQRLYVIHAGEETFQLDQNIQALAFTRLLTDLKPL